MSEADGFDYEEYLAQEYAEQGAEEEYWKWFKETLPRRVSDNLMRSHLNTYGAAVEQRVRNGIEGAERLLAQGFAAPALVSAASSVEVCMTYLLLEGFVFGAILQEVWVDRLMKRLTDLDSGQLFHTVSKFLTRFDIDLNGIHLPTGEAFWQAWRDQVWPKRRAVVHELEPLEGVEGAAIAARAIDCARTLLEDVVYPVALALGFEKDGDRVAWQSVDLEDIASGAKYNCHNSGLSPFADSRDRRA